MLKLFLKYLLCCFLIAFAFLSSKISLFLIAMIFIFVAIKEYRNIFSKKNISVFKFFPEIICSILAYCFVFTNEFFYEKIFFVLIFSLILCFLTAIIKPQKPYGETVFCTFFAILFVCCGLFTIKINDFTTPCMIAIFILSVLISDFSASIAGLKIKKKIFLSEKISPNKTLAGNFAHILTSVLILFFSSDLIGLSKIQGAILGLIISLSSQIGDLSISCLKRDCDVKHSSLLFGENGGLLDRLDAFVFSAPIVYCFLLWIS